MKIFRILGCMSLALLLIPLTEMMILAGDEKPVQKQSSSVSRTGGTRENQPPKPIIAFDTVYVRDFSIDASDIKKDSGVASGGRRGRLPFGKKKNDVREKANKLITTMTDTLIEEFTKQGVKTSRISRSQIPPKTGILVDGSFTLIDEGSRMKRALIGFGQGEARAEVYVTVFNLSVSSDSPVIAFGSDKNSKKMPGAVVTLNPYAAAAKFVLEKNATEKIVKHLAGTIAEEILKFRSPSIQKP